VAIVCSGLLFGFARERRGQQNSQSAQVVKQDVCKLRAGYPSNRGHVQGTHAGYGLCAEIFSRVFRIAKLPASCMHSIWVKAELHMIQNLGSTGGLPM
jgi:hypothetical protein